MSTVLRPIITDQEQNTTLNELKTTLLPSKRSAKYSIKHKENIFKHKCNKTLKNKLKKYKLRKDGKEDPDVINVSHTFQCSLRIKSPNKNNNTELTVWDSEIRPRNYLFKMAKRKRDLANVKTIKPLVNDHPHKSTGSQVPNDETEDKEILSQNSQNKKHTNAFQLMMSSRNKSIGGNSPGKEKPVDNTDSQLMTEEKNNKAKRLLVLQKMAEAKGSLKKKVEEELLDEAINRKMEKRAERLTKMLVSSDKCKKNKPGKQQPLSISKEIETKPCMVDKKEEKSEKQVPSQKSNTLQIIDIFNESIKNVSEDSKDKRAHKEEMEFLKKLSPSIRKQENMLCYFKRIDKDIECLTPVKVEDNEHSSVIKVKIALRNKKKPKKNLTLKIQKNHESDNRCIKPEDEQNISSTDTSSKSSMRKRKRKPAPEVKNIPEISENIESLTDSVEVTETLTGRPKRNVKKPVQYKDDFVLSSSDDEYNIFTPKKKKSADKESDISKLSNDSKSPVTNNIKVTKSSLKENKKMKPPKDIDISKNNSIKLAPIFAPKPQLDMAALEAKQKFLQSGVPDKLKKIAHQQKQIEKEINYFPVVVHVQQSEIEGSVSNSSLTDVLESDPETEINPLKWTKTVLKEMLSPTKVTSCKKLAIPDNSVHEVLQNIKLDYPKFPVYRTYNLLRAKSIGEFGNIQYPELDNSVEILNNEVDFQKIQVDKLNWTDKYKPMSTKEIIGNFATVKELKKWLESWTLNDAKVKMNDKANSDSSDFCYSDTDSRDSMKTTDNLLILTGPTGCGKTSCVHAVAAELSIKVIEVNASGRRNGKIMLQDLQEATQSHKVNRGKGSSAENSQKSQDVIEVDFTIKAKKRGRPKKNKDVEDKPKNLIPSQTTNSQENVRTGMSLILIDDADIIFDQDEGFCSAIAQLIQYSKRPVILVTTSLACPHLQRFLQGGKIMTMKPLLPRMLGTWLDIMCLASGGTCWPGLGSVLLDFFKGDIRKTINCLQFYTSTSMQQDSTQHKSEIFYDENSCMSWAGSENQEENDLTTDRCSPQGVDTVWKYIMEKESHLLHVKFPSGLWNVWWNLPNFLKKGLSKSIEVSDDKPKKNCELGEIANIVDNISAADYFSHLRPDANKNLCSQSWYSSESDSTSECENFSYYNRRYDIHDEISKTLVVRSICNAQRQLQYDNELHIHPLRMSIQRDRDRVISRHDDLSAQLNPAATLDRRSLALDYWSSCRTICRSEKEKTDNNSKRNNRFCHYLRSLKIMCKNDVFDKLGESLKVKEK